MTTVRVTIEPAVLDWAIERTGLSLDDLVKDFPRIREWVENTSQPTLNQAQDLAKKAKIPFGRLLLQTPSEPRISVPDFRTVRNLSLETFSPNLEDTLAASESRLDWYADFAEEEGVDGPSFLGCADTNKNPEAIADRTREVLGLAADTFLQGPDKVKTLCATLETSGILVSRNSIVESSTTRPLSIDEFRGFTLIQTPYALIFINTRDSKTAQLFSLSHELGHVVLGQPGISDHGESRDIERWCNRFASSFLAPAPLVLSTVLPSDSPVDSVKTLSRKSGMSQEAALWRLVHLNVIDRSEASTLLPLVASQPIQATEPSSSKGGPARHRVVKARVGSRFFDAVTYAAVARKIPQKEAAQLLGAATADSLSTLIAHSPSAEWRAS